MKMTLVIASGLGDLALAVFHIGFWRLFGWPESLAGSGRLNAAISQVMNIMLIYLFTVIGVALLWLGAAAPPLLLIAAGGFGALRIALQPLYFGMRHWASKGLSAIFLILTLLHLGAAFA